LHHQQFPSSNATINSNDLRKRIDRIIIRLDKVEGEKVRSLNKAKVISQIIHLCVKEFQVNVSEVSSLEVAIL
jgi:hypothetical protein